MKVLYLFGMQKSNLIFQRILSSKEIKMRQFCLILLIILSVSSHAQNLTGTYKSLQQSDTYLYLNADSTFFYERGFHAGHPIDGYEGIWKIKGKQIFLSPPKNQNTIDQIMKVDKFYNEKLDRNKIQLSIIDWEERQDLLGGHVVFHNEKFLIDENPIIVNTPVDSISIHFFDQTLTYKFKKSENFNRYTFYVNFYPRRNYAVMPKPPFRKLTFLKDELLDGKKRIFQRYEPPIDTLDEMANILNRALPDFRSNYDFKGFYEMNDVPVNFFVFDLIDTSANTLPNHPIKFKSTGIYHFAPVKAEYSFSHIAVMKNNKIRIFKSLNCPTGDKIESVIEYLNQSGNYSEVILDRIKNYRQYGRYIKSDPQAILNCK